jgi:hypothetical protein
LRVDGTGSVAFVDASGLVFIIYFYHEDIILKSVLADRSVSYVVVLATACKRVFTIQQL